MTGDRILPKHLAPVFGKRCDRVRPREVRDDPAWDSGNFSAASTQAYQTQIAEWNMLREIGRVRGDQFLALESQYVWPEGSRCLRVQVSFRLFDRKDRLNSRTFRFGQLSCKTEACKGRSPLGSEVPDRDWLRAAMAADSRCAT